VDAAQGVASRAAVMILTTEAHVHDIHRRAYANDCRRRRRSTLSHAHFPLSLSLTPHDSKYRHAYNIYKPGYLTFTLIVDDGSSCFLSLLAFKLISVLYFFFWFRSYHIQHSRPSVLSVTLDRPNLPRSFRYRSIIHTVIPNRTISSGTSFSGPALLDQGRCSLI